MAAALETERQKLLASGLSEAAVAKRVADLEAKTRAESERQLAAFRQQAEAERVAQEQAAEQLRAEYQRSLSTAQTDRSRIQEEAARKQADLEAGYREKQLGLEQDKAAALAELETLRRARERETLVLDQFVSFYREVRGRDRGEPARGGRRGAGTVPRVPRRAFGHRAAGDVASAVRSSCS